jgi:hypothetical protein
LLVAGAGLVDGDGANAGLVGVGEEHEASWKGQDGTVSALDGEVGRGAGETSVARGCCWSFTASVMTGHLPG